MSTYCTFALKSIFGIYASWPYIYGVKIIFVSLKLKELCLRLKPNLLAMLFCQKLRLSISSNPEGKNKVYVTTLFLTN